MPPHVVARAFAAAFQPNPIALVRASFDPAGVGRMFSFARSQKLHDQEKLVAIDRSMAIIEFTPDGTILAANENFCKTLGYAAEEIIGKHHSIFVEADYSRSSEYQAFWRKLGGGAYDSAQYRRIRRDGAPIYIQATYNPIMGPNGRVVGVLKIAADITEAKLRSIENEAKMDALSRVQATIEFKPSGEIIDANDNFFATMGYQRDEIVGKHHRMFVESNYANSQEYQDFWRKLNSGQPIVDSFRRVGKGGKLVVLQASYCPVLDLDGKVSKVVKFANNITELVMLGDALARLSKGDIEKRLDKPFAATFDKLRVDFNVAADNLNVVLGGIVGAIDVVGASAEEIASASRDLSRRTEGQAASLEETAAALEQVTATVNKTTENARLANQVVRAAKGDAEKSGDIVSRAVDAMGRIEHSSEEIGKIIGVIDEIAFQTNLLALNAGVEAARAGEAGRGFAVVASEVRALAQRSAEAAKQIKGFIAASGADVGAGVKLVRQTGDALGQIVAKVMEINTLVGDIAAGAEEQNAALSSVNSAVSQMDQATQQNAAMAEEANAAVESMKQQIDRLVESIGEFKLAETATGGGRRIERATHASERKDTSGSRSTRRAA
jgi:methyl-accepting chemotaxis protein